MSRIFLSHSRDDTDIVLDFFDFFKTYYLGTSSDFCYEIFCTAHNTQRSGSKTEAMEFMRKKDSHFILFASQNALKSPSVGWELGFFEAVSMKKEKPITVINLGLMDFADNFHMGDANYRAEIIINFTGLQQDIKAFFIRNNKPFTLDAYNMLNVIRTNFMKAKFNSKSNDVILCKSMDFSEKYIANLKKLNIIKSYEYEQEETILYLTTHGQEIFSDIINP